MARANDFMLKSDRDLLSARFERRRLAWEKKRRRGMAFFILTETLKVGVFVVVIDLLMSFAMDIGRSYRIRSLYLWEGALIGLAIIVLGSFWEWHRNEKRYHG